MNVAVHKSRGRGPGRWGILGASLLLTACMSTQLGAVLDGLVASHVQGSPFAHRVYVNSAFADARSEAHDRNRPNTIHIYIDGDGRPWRNDRVAADPSPRGMLVLRMLQQDRRPALYLGRPCHFTLPEDQACGADDYTFGRYSEQVLNSMVVALHKKVPDGARLILIGHSGGGTLAVLLAARLPEVVGVVTIAANLDLDAWTRLHGYTPLYASVDPARQPALRVSIAQLHLSGAADVDVPTAITRAGLQRQASASLRVVPGFDHRCCWLKVWPGVLGEIATW